MNRIASVIENCSDCRCFEATNDSGTEWRCSITKTDLTDVVTYEGYFTYYSGFPDDCPFPETDLECFN